jgi:hypothetical protein
MHFNMLLFGGELVRAETQERKEKGSNKPLYAFLYAIIWRRAGARRDAKSAKRKLLISPYMHLYAIIWRRSGASRDAKIAKKSFLYALIWSLICLIW